LKRVIVVDGEKVVADVDEELPIVDVDMDIRRVAAQMGFWGNVKGAAEREKEATDAYYRRWRGQKTLDVNKAQPSLSEYKVKAEVEADDQFLKLKDAYARCCEACEVAGNMFTALEKRANLLQSVGAKLRTELEAGRKATTKVRVPSAAPKPAEVDEDEEAKDEATPVVEAPVPVAETPAPAEFEPDDEGDSPAAAKEKMSKLKLGKKKKGSTSDAGKD
jgi:hypothetical protein